MCCLSALHSAIQPGESPSYSDSWTGWDFQDQSHSIETPSPSTDLMSLRQNLLLCRRSQCLHSAYRRDLADRGRWGISFCMASVTSSVRLFSVNSISYKRIRRLRRCVCHVDNVPQATHNMLQMLNGRWDPTSTLHRKVKIIK